MADELYNLTSGDVAKQLGVTKKAVNDWADADPPLIKCWRTPGRHRRFRQSDVDAFFEERRT